MAARCGHQGSGFALVELVLVVAIMGIIGAIAIPKFSSAADRAKAAAVAGSVTQLQHSVDLYTAEHADRNPVTEPGGSPTTAGATLVLRLTRYTDDAGNTGASGIFGPYLRTWPTNPYNAKQSIRIDGAAAGANTHGWRIDSATLQIESDQATAISPVGHLGSGGKIIGVGGTELAL